MKKAVTIAIDGPSGAGKSTMAKALAQRLGISYLDTGAMYRGMAKGCLLAGCSPSSLAQVEALLPALNLEVRFLADGQHVFVNGQDVTAELRTPEVSKAASDISALSPVRRYLVQKQRELAEHSSFVLDGRDIGTVVLPQADCKFFLTASPEERARRRFLENQEKGIACDYAAVLADLNYRDQQDSSRADSPLRPAADAIQIDSSALSIDAVLALMMDALKERGLLED